MTDYYNLKTDFGAVGDGETDDYAKIRAFLDACLSTGRPGYIPKGRYVSSSQITINADQQSDSRYGIKLHGAGTHKSVFVINSATPQSFHLYRGAGDVFSYVEFIDFSIECDSPIGLVLGLSNYTDCLGNGMFKNIHVYNRNSGATEVVAAQINFIFDCTFENCVFITETSYYHATALELRNPKFTTFIGCSYSNAKQGILMSNSGEGRGCEELVFTSPDFENTYYCIRNENSYTKNITFINAYFDNRVPGTGTLGKACISSPAGEKGILVFDNPRFAIPGTGLYPDLDKAIDYGVSVPGSIVIRGVYTGFVAPTVSSTPFTYTNGPQKMVVKISDKKLPECMSVKVNGEPEFGYSFNLEPGDIFSIEWFEGDTAPITSWKVIS